MFLQEPWPPLRPPSHSVLRATKAMDGERGGTSIWRVPAGLMASKALDAHVPSSLVLWSPGITHRRCGSSRGGGRARRARK